MGFRFSPLLLSPSSISNDCDLKRVQASTARFVRSVNIGAIILVAKSVPRSPRLLQLGLYLPHLFVSADRPAWPVF
uniref:Secreted protein n=1 Tax=Bursaphelenchus xylophilus TaxID=6326 RepID=A0A1I7RLH0_BURXY